MATTITRDGSAAPLVDTLAALWPEGEVRLVRRRTPGRDLLAELALVPGDAGPRLAVPVTPASAAARALGRVSAASGPREVAARLGAAQVVRFGGLGALADRVQVQGSARGSLQAYLEDEFGHPLRFSLGIGTDRVNRKPVLELFDTEGRALGFVKVGLGPVARADVEAETAALGRLAPLGGTGIFAPRIIHAGRWREAPVLVMERVPAPGTLLDRDRTRVPVVWMREFCRRLAEPPRTLSELPWWAGVAGRLEALPDTAARGAALACADAVREAANVPLPVAAWHGDWTPWNMARHRGGLSLWDWERFETGAPAGLDLVHYLVNVHTVRDGATPRAVAHGLAHAARHIGCSGGDPRVLTGLYLAAISARYLRLAEGPGGGAIADRAACFLSAWQDWSGPR